MTLEEASEHIGDAVVYDDGHGTYQDGTIVRVGKGFHSQFVYVRYGHNDTSIQATLPESLSLLASSVGWTESA